MRPSRTTSILTLVLVVVTAVFLFPGPRERVLNLMQSGGVDTEMAGADGLTATPHREQGTRAITVGITKDVLSRDYIPAFARQSLCRFESKESLSGLVPSNGCTVQFHGEGWRGRSLDDVFDFHGARPDQDFYTNPGPGASLSASPRGSGANVFRAGVLLSVSPHLL